MEFKDKGSGTTMGQRGETCLFYISSPFHPLVCPFPSESPRYVALIPPPPPVCQPNPSLTVQNKPDTLTAWEGKLNRGPGGGEGRRKAERWAGTRTVWLLLRGHQEGNGDLLKFHPWITTSGFQPFHHITHARRLQHVFSTIQKCLCLFYA